MELLTPLRPLATVGWGVLLVALDFRIEGIDLLPDPIGWLMCAVACQSVSAVPGGGAFKGASLVAGIAVLGSLPDWLGQGLDALAVVLSAADTVFVFLVCTAIMAVAPSQSGSANLIRWWNVGLGVVVLVIVAMAVGSGGDETGLGPLLLIGIVAALVVYVCFIVLLFKTAKLPVAPAMT